MQALEFFKATPGFESLLRAMFDTYARNGRAFGAVRLATPTPEEEAAISGFFERDYFGQALLRIGLADFERQLARRFPDAPPLPLFLEGYVGLPMHIRTITGTTGGMLFDTFATAVVTRVMPQFTGTPAMDWLHSLAVAYKRMYRRWYRRFESEPTEVLAELDHVAIVMNMLPQPGRSLVPLYKVAKAATGDPAGLAFKTNSGKLLLRALAEKFDNPVPVEKDDCLNMYARGGILIGGMQSCVLVYGRTMKATPQPRAFTFEGLAELTAVKPAKNVYVLEQPAVFEAVVEALRDENITADIICPIGGVGPAFMHLARLFVAAGATLHYAGRLNYRGLETADSLYAEFGRSFVPWRYDREDFETALSLGENHLLPDGRRTMAMQDDRLGAFLSMLRRRGKTTDSLALVPLFISDITQEA